MSPSNKDFEGSVNEHSKEKVVSPTSTSKSTSILSSSSTSSPSLNISQNMAIDCNSNKILSNSEKHTAVLRQRNQLNSISSIGNSVTFEDRSFSSKFQIEQQQQQQQQPFQQNLQHHSFHQSFPQHQLDQKLVNISRNAQNFNSNVFSQNNGLHIKQDDIQLFPTQNHLNMSNTQRAVLMEQQQQIMQQYPQFQDQNSQLNEFSTFNMIYAKLGDLSDAAIQQYKQVDSGEANSKYYNQTRDSYLNLPIHKGYLGSNPSSVHNDQSDTANVEKTGPTTTPLNMNNSLNGARIAGPVKKGFNGEQSASTPPLYYAQPYVPSAKFQSVFNENYYNPYSSLQQHDEFIQQKEAFLKKRKSLATQAEQKLTDGETKPFNADDVSLLTPRASILSDTDASQKIKAIPQIFLSNKTVEYSNSTKMFSAPLPKDLESLTLYFEMQFKVQQYIFNALPFRLCKDPTNRSLFVRGSHYATLFDYLNHAYFACAFLDLYHQQVNNGYDDVLNLSKQTYLSMAEYYFARSLASQARDISVHEDIKKAVSLVISTTLHIIFILGSPNHNLFSEEILTVARNLGLLFTDYALVFKNCDLFNQASARYCLTEFSTSAEIYFPEYLYGLVDVASPSQTYSFSTSNVQNGTPFSTSPIISYDSSSTYKNLTEYNTGPIKKKIPTILSNEEKSVVFEMVERLKKEFRAIANPSIYHNPYTCVRQVPLDLLISDQQSPITNEKVLEYDMLGSLTRFLIDIPESFAAMVENKDPRALIWLAHALMVIASRGYPFWSPEVYIKKLEQIEAAMDGYEDGEFWNGWLAIPREMLTNFSI
ncbi:hypothetical protein BVG19_g2568 [[Candida] boidinii]|nr:hypothetical protein BVG19_g2568 [[Candida] boidinii]OWB49164.1 hypothetical protein B5S27_g704 [[Candida] boidinii]